jgi:hypothetical protein
MKRDMNLVRHILLHIESPAEVTFDAMGHDQRSILDHMALLAKAGYIEADFLPGEDGKVAGLMNETLTWEGHTRRHSLIARQFLTFDFRANMP